jgi:hypothetical protein
MRSTPTSRRYCRPICRQRWSRCSTSQASRSNLRARPIRHCRTWKAWRRRRSDAVTVSAYLATPALPSAAVTTTRQARLAVPASRSLPANHGLTRSCSAEGMSPLRTGPSAVIGCSVSCFCPSGCLGSSPHQLVTVVAQHTPPRCITDVVATSDWRTAPGARRWPTQRRPVAEGSR